ncbi:hypothetical protein [Sphingomonas sp. Leaf226]|uniref:hypothetical protein n=1 Tax=Sphingomonas sp. Leaf226 TaxID=1735691 RepID=UPI0006F5F461|nr:hypothetical protein [Sphingomonas sp. Leaf226]KQM99450.1 hypothetical protein ASE77_00170 [Sphingomonas sp. Leaf226]
MAQQTLLRDIEAFIARTGASDSAIGRASVNDWKFVRDLRGGRRVWPETEAKVRAFMANHVATVEQKEAA